MKNNTNQIPTLCVRGKDLSFVDEMVAGGVVDNMSSLDRGITFDDTNDYSGVVVSNEEVKQYLASFAMKNIPEELNDALNYFSSEECAIKYSSLGSGGTLTQSVSYPKTLQFIEKIKSKMPRRIIKL